MIVRLSPAIRKHLSSFTRTQLLAFADLVDKVSANPIANSVAVLHSRPVQRCVQSPVLRLTFELRSELEDPEDRSSLTLILYLVDCEPA